MTDASAIHVLDSLTAASWVLAGGAVLTVIIAVAASTFVRMHQANQEGKLSSLVGSVKPLTSRLGPLSRITIGGSGRHVTQKVSKPLTFTHFRRPSISTITGVAAIASIAVSVSLSINNQETAGSKLPKNVLAVLEQQDTISVLETTPSGNVNLVSLRKNASNTVTVPPPNPGAAQHIAYITLPSYGWSPGKYFSCLNNLWQRESGWRYDAQNAAGGYGIPQSLPGSKMASAGADWQTNPATQIKWGFGYIKAIYGDPCKAWAFWQANHYY